MPYCIWLIDTSLIGSSSFICNHGVYKINYTVGTNIHTGFWLQKWHIQLHYLILSFLLYTVILLLEDVITDSSAAAPTPTLVEAITLIWYCVPGLRPVSRWYMVVSLEENMIVEFVKGSSSASDS